MNAIVAGSSSLTERPPLIEAHGFLQVRPEPSKLGVRLGPLVPFETTNIDTSGNHSSNLRAAWAGPNTTLEVE